MPSELMLFEQIIIEQMMIEQMTTEQFCSIVRCLNDTWWIDTCSMFSWHIAQLSYCSIMTCLIVILFN